MSTAAISEFQQLLFSDPRLQEELRALTDQQDFALRLTTLGQERNLECSVDEVIAAMNENRRQWLQRWLG